VAPPKRVKTAKAVKAESESSLGRLLLQAAGTGLGGLLGGPAGAAIGNSAANMGATILGLGAYTVKQNSFLPTSSMRIVNPTHPGETVIRHREYLQDIFTSSTANTFKIQQFPINAAHSETFPFLSQIAQNYEQFRVEGMLFEFRSMSADALNSTNTALGSVIMATQYNAANPPFTSKSQMENYEFGESCKPSSCMVHMIECARIQTTIDELYTRAGAVPAGQDQRLYDLGSFQIATTGFQGTSVNVGELWVTYQVALLKPKLFVTNGDEIGNFKSTSPYSDAHPVSSNVALVQVLTDNIGIVFDGNTIAFPASNIIKHFTVVLAWTATSPTSNMAGLVYPTITPSNATLGAAFGSPVAGDLTTTVCSYSVPVTTLGNGLSAALTFGAGFLPITNTVNTIWIYQTNSHV